MKQAYPNFSTDDSNIKPVYNLNRWLGTLREIYAQSFYGKDRSEVLKTLTKEWGAVEKQDFLAWMNFYEGKNHLKYKKAQLYMNDNIPGYFLPNPKNSPPAPIASLHDPIEVSQSKMQEQLTQEEKRRIIEDQRRRMLGRLTSLEKLLGSKEGHMLVGNEFEKLFTTINDLKRQIHLVNKVSLSNQLYKDLIIREANKLSHNGLNKSATVLYKFAQNTPGNFDAAQGPLPLASKIDNQGTLTNTLPMDAMKNPPEDKPKNPLDELLDNLETGGLTETDENKIEDENEDEVSVDDEELTVVAQMAPPPPPTAPMPPRDVVEMPSPTDELAVGAPEGQQSISPDQEKDIDAMIDGALSSITTKDVVDRLENVISIFRNRQLSRELTVIDMMLHRLNIISLFPEMLEANNKTMEMHTYVLTRLEKVVSQLRGTIEKSKIDLVPAPQEMSPEVSQVKNQIENQQQKEKDRKEMRKQLQDDQVQEQVEELQAPTAPIPQVGTELAAQPQPTLAPNV